MTRQLSASEISRADRIAETRIRQKIPLAYLLKEAWLGRSRFYVDQRAIVPRSFIAELLEDRLVPWLSQEYAPTRGLDMCTGSGCLAILMAKAFPHMQVHAVDLSADALAVAKINVQRFGLNTRVKLIHSDLFSRIPKRERYDLIVSNPPYVKASSMKALPEEYLHEPSIALAGGTDGLTMVRSIVMIARRFLKPKGLLVIEVGHNKRAMERAFPQTPIIWLDTPSSEGMVALIETENIPCVSSQGT